VKLRPQCVEWSESSTGLRSADTSWRSLGPGEWTGPSAAQVSFTVSVQELFVSLHSFTIWYKSCSFPFDLSNFSIKLCSLRLVLTNICTKGCSFRFDLSKFRNKQVRFALILKTKPRSQLRSAFVWISLTLLLRCPLYNSVFSRHAIHAVQKEFPVHQSARVYS
jgi:hypothetical protein